MKQFSGHLTKSYRKPLIYIILLLSGISALIYQVIWIRKFGLVFGVHVFSMSTVLTAFMAGLALGSLWFGRIADRSKNPLLLFLRLELGIALFAILFPIIFKGLILVYTGIAGNFYINPYMLQLIRFFFSFLILLIPTTLMGGTLPVMMKYFIKDSGLFGSKVSSLYSVNNLGAVLGCFAAGYFLINLTGLLATLYIAALLNLLNALAVYLLYRSERKTESPVVKAPEEKPVVPAYPPWMVKLVLGIFAIEGFTTLAYEVIWTRVLVAFSFDKTTYFYTVILIGFIFGLSLGSLLIRRFIDRIRDLPGMLVYIQVLIGITSIVSLIIFSKIAPVLIRSRDMFGSWFSNSGKEYFIFFLLLTIPTTLMGMTYPVVSKIYAGSISKLGKKMGLIGFMDTAGSILGAFAAGFLLIPMMGVVNSFLFTVMLNLLLGVMVLISNPRYSHMRKLIYLGAILSVSFFVYQGVPVKNYFSWWDNLENQELWFADHYDKVLFYDEGDAATVMVLRYPSEETRSLMINGHNTAFTSKRDLSANRQLGYLPYILHPNPKNAFVVGFGLGVTAHTLSRPDLHLVDVAEIVPGVIHAAPVFSKWNYNATQNEGTRIFEEDGRSLLLMTREKYDIITSNAIHPRLSNNIYTRDFYRICYDKLAEGGIICQWIPQNWMNEREYKSLIRAFTDVFQDCSLWYVNEYSTLIIGSNKPVEVSWQQIQEKFSDSLLNLELAEVGIRNPQWFLAQYWMTDTQLREWVKGFPANTDNNPLVEFSRVMSIEPNLSVMHDLVRIHPDYSIFFKNGNHEEMADLAEGLNVHSDYYRNSMIAVIDAVHYHRTRRISQVKADFVNQ